jgi:hypothetical protein
MLTVDAWDVTEAPIPLEDFDGKYQLTIPVSPVMFMDDVIAQVKETAAATGDQEAVSAVCKWLSCESDDVEEFVMEFEPCEGDGTIYLTLGVYED